MKPTCLVLFLLAALAATGCSRRRELVLPPGDAERGREAFIALKCHECHRVDGITDLPAPTAAPDRVVTLGGEVTQLRTYDALVTSIIHPNAGISELMRGEARGATVTSPMPVVNEEMKVAQMVDLVTFLLPRYRRIPPPDWPGLYGP